MAAAAVSGRDAPGRNSVSTATAITIASSSTHSSIAERRSRANASSRSLRLSQPQAEERHEDRCLDDQHTAVGGRPHLRDAVQLGQGTPEPGQCQYADGDRRRSSRSAARSANARPHPRSQRGTTNTSDTSPPSQIAAAVTWARSIGTAEPVRLVTVECVSGQRRSGEKCDRTETCRVQQPVVER